MPLDKRAKADALSQIFDEDIIKHMYSSKWQQREKGYEMANGYTLSILQKADDVIAVQKLIFDVIQEGLMDKIVQVNLKAMKICETYLSAKVSDNPKPINEITDFENIIVLVFDKLAISKIGKNVESVIMKMIESPQINLESFMDFMFKPTSFMKEKCKESYVHLLPRFKIAKTVINNLKMLESTKRITKEHFPLKNLEERIVAKYGLSSSYNERILHTQNNDGSLSDSKELRTMTKDLIIDMYNIFGYKRIEEFIQRLDLKFLTSIADSKKTPEIQAYLDVADNTA